MVNAVLLSVLAALLAYEAEAWFPRIVALLIDRSARALPKRQRKRFHEEWQAHVDEMPGAIMKVWHAIGFLVASRRMFPRWRRSLAYKRSLVRGSFAVRATVRLLDFAVASVALVVLFPLMLGVTIAASLHGSPLTAQRRVGQGGNEFYLYKFRTMRQTCEDDGSARMTWVGEFLVRTAIDELPTLLNVVRGQMGMFGPRPTIRNDNNLKPGIAPFLEVLPTGSSEPRSVVYYVFRAVRCYFAAVLRTVQAVLKPM